MPDARGRGCPIGTKTRPTCGCWKKVVETLKPSGGPLSSPSPRLVHYLFIPDLIYANKHPGADIRRWKQFEDTECFNCGQKAEEVE